MNWTDALSFKLEWLKEKVNWIQIKMCNFALV